MTRQISQISKRIVPLMLAIMLIASAVFVPTVVSANTVNDSYAEVGLHAPTVFDFNDGSTEGITSDFESTEVLEGTDYLYVNSAANKTLRFDAYGDIETYSFDMMFDTTGLTKASYSPSFIFYDEIYKDKDGNDVIANSRMDISYTPSSGEWALRTKGLYSGMVKVGAIANFPAGGEWVTITLNYSMEYADYSGRTDRLDDYGNRINCKRLSSLTLTQRGSEEPFYTYAPTSNYEVARITYGVNASLTDNEDNENVTLGFNSTGNMIPTYFDNFKVIYRNAPKVSAMIDEIGDVTASEECLAKIVKAENAYALLEESQKASIAADYATLTAARASYNELVANADVTEVVNKIAAIGAVDASAECLAKIEAAEEAYAALSPEKQARVSNYQTLVKARADYKVAYAAQYGIHCDDVIDFTDSVSSTVDGVTENSLTVNGTADSIYYNVYGDINTVTYDMYVHSTATTGTVNLPSFRYYDFDANTYDSTNEKDRVILSLQSGTLKINSGEGWPTYGTQITDYSTLFGKWVTVEYKYSDAYSTRTSSGVTYERKYIDKITIKDGDTTIVDWSMESAYDRWMLGYGIDLTATPDAKDPETVKIGFIGQNTKTDLRNLKVTYRDNAEKVIGYIDDIGEVTATDESLAKITFADEAYALLSDAEKAEVTNYATLTAAKETYNNLVENADVFAVVEKIDAIGTVEATDDCLAKIVAAEDAYAALSDEKQALVSNYDALVKARADYERAYAAQYGIHCDDVIDFTDSVSSTVDGVTENSLTVNGTADSIYYNVYGDINTVTYDMYVHSTATTGTVNLPNFKYYDFDANTYDSTNEKDRVILSLQSGTLKINSGEGWPTYGTQITDYSTLFGKWVTVEYKYSDAYSTHTGSGVTYERKYIDKITIKDGDTTIVDWSMEGTYNRWMLGYGIDITATPDAKDPETVKIGFIGQGTQTDLRNLKVTYKNTAAAEKVGAIETFIVDNSADCEQTIADIKATYALLPESMKTEKLTAAIASAEATLEVIKNASADAAPKMNGATIRATLETGDQNIRYNSSMPTADINGYSIVEYGTVMFPNQLLNGQELTLDTTYNGENVISAKSTVEEGAELPTDWNSELYGIDTADSMARCGLRIAARSYIKYSDGNNTFILYSSNNVDGYDAQTAPTVGVNDGVCVRSVFSVARAMTTALLDTDKYSEEAYGDIVYSEDHIASKDDYANATGVDAITFVFNNQTRLGKIVDAR